MIVNLQNGWPHKKNNCCVIIAEMVQHFQLACNMLDNYIPNRLEILDK